MSDPPSRVRARQIQISQPHETGGTSEPPRNPVRFSHRFFRGKELNLGADMLFAIVDMFQYGGRSWAGPITLSTSPQLTGRFIFSR